MGMLPFFHQAYRTKNDKPAGRGTCSVYATGSTTELVPLYADYLYTTPISNPLTLDGLGVVPKYFLKPGVVVDVIVRDIAGNVLDSAVGLSTSDGSGGGGTTTYLTEIQSFPSGEGMLVDGSDDLWGDGCFVWWIPAKNIQSLKYFKMSAPGHAGPTSPGKYAIWKCDGVTAVKVRQGQIPDSELTDIEYFDAAIGEEWPYVVVACDPVSGVIPEYVKQMRLTVPSVTSSPFPSNMAYIGLHAHNEAFLDDQIPTIKGADPIYLMTKWMAIGAIVSGV